MDSTRSIKDRKGRRSSSVEMAGDSFSRDIAFARAPGVPLVAGPAQKGIEYGLQAYSTSVEDCLAVPAIVG